MRASLNPGRPLERSASRCSRKLFRGLNTTTARTALAGGTAPIAWERPTAGTADPATATMEAGAGERGGVDAAVGAAVAAGMAHKAAKAAMRIQERPVNSRATVSQRLAKIGWWAAPPPAAQPSAPGLTRNV